MNSASERFHSSCRNFRHIKIDLIMKLQTFLILCRPVPFKRENLHVIIAFFLLLLTGLFFVCVLLHSNTDTKIVFTCSLSTIRNNKLNICCQNMFFHVIYIFVIVLFNSFILRHFMKL